MTTIIPGRPARPIEVTVEGQPSVSVDASGRIPPGGTTGQALVKISDGNFATGWGTIASITVGTTPPASPAIGDLWVDTN